MGFSVRKIFGGEAKPEVLADKVLKPITRLNEVGMFQSLGAVQHAKDTRTHKEIVQTLKAYAESIPEVKEFMAHISEMKPEHLNLAADTIELAQRHDMIMTHVDLMSNAKGGKSILGLILEKMPQTSKNNPNWFGFMTKIIDNTDSITSKFFLTKMAGADAQTVLDRNRVVSEIINDNIQRRTFNSPGEKFDYIENLRKTLLSEHEIPVAERSLMDMQQFGDQMKAAEEFVPIAAKDTLDGAYLGTFERQSDFMNLLGAVVNPQSRVNKIRLLPELTETVHNVSSKTYPIDIQDFVSSNAPTLKVKENIKTFTDVAKLAEAQKKDINVVDFVLNNTNLY